MRSWLFQFCTYPIDSWLQPQLDPNIGLWLLLFHHHNPEADAEAHDNADDNADETADDDDAIDNKASPRAGIDWTSVPILYRHHTTVVQH